MPRYDYLCQKCDKSLTLVHGITESVDYCDCGQGGKLERQLSDLFCKSTRSSLPKSGQLVIEYIEQTKKDLIEEKRSLAKEYKDDT
jgi:putative FmdB family regulatory protein